MKKTIMAIILLMLLLSACGQTTPDSGDQKVGLLVPDTVSDQVWGTKGYKGLLRIQTEYDLDVYYKEGIHTDSSIKKAVEEFHKDGVTLIFGHGSEYAQTFNAISSDYPNIHFVCFNSEAQGENVTSLNFEANAMGFFGGMVAGHMSKTNNIGIIAAFEWQPEVDGFFEGVLHENPDARVLIDYTQDWDDPDKALDILDNMLEQEVDVVYPAGDGFNVPIINSLKEKGLYAVGFVSDQSDLGENTVITSTVQHIPALYELVARRHFSGELDSGNLYFDFKDEVISLGKFSPLVSKEYQENIHNQIEEYKNSGLLPNEK
ncbi:BMP family ABC transporter substrate-binding protein [Sutcliffiella horikoshii]|uniref:BMP family ABC transporter substrate-binding protein n=1 Tax=Sutcliffiella horikoshii TaxID=79883 RepID=UPI001F22E426|nr:BMP family ABC transporter substrate-binding protein [Sutcliffiella horikoshii]MCG1020095.1 BMP family ABC transporter substrate-binding protein [Sutcliffiella horikoshii]